MNSESANKFISALVKALQTLCHGYVEFNDGIEIIGHIYLNIDSGSSFDYVVKEKLCKNSENSTVFVSKSFQAQAPGDECLSRKEKVVDQAAEFEDASMSSTTGTSRLQSAITSISNVLSGAQDNQKSRLLDNSSHHAVLQNTGKRKREHNGSYSGMQPPFKYTTLQASSSSPYFSSGPSSSKLAADKNHSEHYSNPTHAEFFGGDSNQSSGMGGDDEDDLHLDVTFVKEEYESQRSSGQRGVSASVASRLSQDPSSSHSSILHDGAPTLGYSSSHHQGAQQFTTGTVGEIGSLNDSFQDSSQVDMSHHSGQGLPNPRSVTSAAQEDMESDSATLKALKLEGMAGISDTLQLGIKLFGAKFVADVASGDLDFPSASVNLVCENGTDSATLSNASVFPDMFDFTSVSDTTIKPGHKILWRDRKDKLRKTYLMRKANLSKVCNMMSAERNLDDENVLNHSVCDVMNRIDVDSKSIGQLNDPYRRKRGRPPKKLKMFGCPEDMYLETTPVTENLSPNIFKKEQSTNSTYSLSMHLLSECTTSVRSFFERERCSRRVRGCYRQYTAADKLDIINYGIKFGSTAASRKYNIPESTVRSWTKKMDTFIMQMKLSEIAESQVSEEIVDVKDPLATSTNPQNNDDSGTLVDSYETALMEQTKSQTQNT